MADTENIKEVVGGLLAERFKGANIVSVSVTEDTDADGDQVLRVLVVYDPAAKKLEPSKLSGFLRSLRPALGDKGETRFPVMSFVTRRDFEQLSGAA